MLSDITVFIDEGGDPGVKDGLKFCDTRYEWFTLGAYVIRTENEPNAVATVRKIMEGVKGYQKPDLHYANLPLASRVPACRYIATVPSRAFCLLSHKTNLREYTNPILGKMKSSQFYNWCCRLLLERVMYWYRQQIDNGDVAENPIKIVFSERGGHDYEHMFSYFERLIDQAKHGGFKKKPKCFEASMMNRSHWSIEPHSKIAGLQLADAIASAFYQAANRRSPNWAVEPARALAPIMGERLGGSACDVGVTVWPLYHQAKLPDDTHQIFKHYGYRFN